MTTISGSTAGEPLNLVTKLSAVVSLFAVVGADLQAGPRTSTQPLLLDRATGKVKAIDPGDLGRGMSFH